MKRLKYACPFGGKRYPWIVAGFATILMPFVLLSFDLSFSLSSMIWAPICVLVICFCYEQHLTPDERAIVAETEPPLWNIATPELIDEIHRTENKSATGELAAAGVLAGVICLIPISALGFTGLSIILCLLIVLGCIFAFLHTLRQSEHWAQIDESAVYIDIPIHHMYDVKYTRSHRRALSWQDPDVWYVSYLVFYLHDGRYILQVPAGDGDKKTMRIIKFKNSIRWMLL